MSGNGNSKSQNLKKCENLPISRSIYCRVARFSLTVGTNTFFTDLISKILFPLAVVNTFHLHPKYKLLGRDRLFAKNFYQPPNQYSSYHTLLILPIFEPNSFVIRLIYSCAQTNRNRLPRKRHIANGILNLVAPSISYGAKKEPIDPFILLFVRQVVCSFIYIFLLSIKHLQISIHLYIHSTCVNENIFEFVE